MHFRHFHTHFGGIGHSGSWAFLFTKKILCECGYIRYFTHFLHRECPYLEAPWSSRVRGVIPQFLAQISTVLMHLPLEENSLFYLCNHYFFAESRKMISSKLVKDALGISKLYSHITVEPPNNGHVGDNNNSAVVSFVERLSSRRRFKMY